MVTHDLVDINLNIRILLGRSYYDDWDNDGEMFVKNDPLGNPVDQQASLEPDDDPAAAEARLQGQIHLGHVAALVRQADQATTWPSTPAAARSPGSGPRPWPAWSTSATSRRPATASRSTCPRPPRMPEVEFEWKIPKWSNAIERDRARTYFQAYAARCAYHFVEQAMKELHAGRTKTWTEFKVPDEAIGCGFHEAVRGVLSHHVVIRNGKIANYHPYPPTPWNANPRDIYGTPGPYEDAVQNTPIFEENGPDKFKGIDIMRAVRSFDPCLPCGVHMYLGDGKVLETRHVPMFGVQGESHEDLDGRAGRFSESMAHIETLLQEVAAGRRCAGPGPDHGNRAGSDGFARRRP